MDYVCLECGYIEEYIEHKDILDIVRAHISITELITAAVSAIQVKDHKLWS